MNLCGIEGLYKFSFMCGCPLVSAPFVESSIHVVLDCLCSFVKEPWTIFGWVYFWAISPNDKCILLPIPCCLDYCSCVVILEIEYCPLILTTFFSAVLVILDLFPFRKYTWESILLKSLLEFYFPLKWVQKGQMGLELWKWPSPRWDSRRVSPSVEYTFVVETALGTFHSGYFYPPFDRATKDLC